MNINTPFDGERDLNISDSAAKEILSEVSKFMESAPDFETKVTFWVCNQVEAEFKQSDDCLARARFAKIHLLKVVIEAHADPFFIAQSAMQLGMKMQRWLDSARERNSHFKHGITDLVFLECASRNNFQTHLIASETKLGKRAVQLRMKELGVGKRSDDTAL